jgi:hypothetical protein
MSDSPDKELENLFPDDLSKVDLKRVVKKARRFTVLRNAVISVVSSVVVFVGAYLLNVQLLNVSRLHLESSILLLNQISGPNVYLGNEFMRDGWFGGQLQIQTYKMIEGVPIPWSTDSYVYNIFGGFSYMAGSYGPSPQISTPTGLRVYNAHTEQREMVFYHPDIKYTHYMNDLSLLKNVPTGKYVEMAISFDKKYDFHQIQSMLPKGVHAVWYWVNTYSSQDIELRSSQTPNVFPMMSYEVYGFENEPYVNQPDFRQTPKDFIKTVESGLKIHGSFRRVFQQIYDVLSHGKGSINPSDVKIIGVVVTGTPHDLLALQGKTYVKAAVLGAIANPY